MELWWDHIHNLLRRDTQNLLHSVGVYNHVALRSTRPGAQHPHVSVDQLHHVLIVGDQQHVQILLRGFLRQAPDDVVRFITVELQNRQPHRFAEPPHIRQLQ